MDNNYAVFRKWAECAELEQESIWLTLDEAIEHKRTCETYSNDSFCILMRVDDIQIDPASMDYWEMVIKPEYYNIGAYEGADTVEQYIWKDTEMFSEDVEAKGMEENKQVWFRAGYLAGLKGGNK